MRAVLTQNFFLYIQCICSKQNHTLLLKFNGVSPTAASEALQGLWEEAQQGQGEATDCLLLQAALR